MNINNAANPANEGKPEEKKYSSEQVAAKLNLSVRTVYNKRMNGSLPFNQQGEKGHVYFTDEDLMVYHQRIKKNWPD